jgi:putative flippase GtrA
MQPSLDGRHAYERQNLHSASSVPVQTREPAVCRKGNRTFSEPIMFAMVGVLNTLVDLVLFWFLVSFAVHPLLANVVSYGIGSVNSYFLNSRVTFRQRGAQQKSALATNRVLAFLGVKIVTLALSTATLSLALLFEADVPAKVISIGVTFGAAYFLTSRLAFAGRRKCASEA